MNKILIAASVLMIATPAFALNNVNTADDIQESSYNQEERQNEAERNEEYPYESTTGTRYKYDLNNPSDKIMYNVDPAAQVMDRVNPMVDIDRGMGQYGGGAE